MKDRTGTVQRFATRAVFGARQLTRMAWYAAHGLVLRRLSEAERQRDGQSSRPPPQANRPVPGRHRFHAEIADLLRRDLANVEAGLYPMPTDHDGPLLVRLKRSRLFFSDLPDVHRRRESGQWNEVETPANRATRPAYYLQNFHFQTDGYLSENSALRYDTQVEVLFGGMANLIRRQALPPLKEIFIGRDQRKLSLLDLG
ncbi:MAG TPA: class I SAM-dependent methyltransferase, partial [Methylocella sp.]|nr:class I SAM-dependent methyltransferase [Methylocella sp.]